MEYRDDTILKAFQIYAGLASKGELAKVDSAPYFEDETIRSLVDNYAKAVQCTLVHDADYLYLIPIAMDSPFHMSNDSIKKEYMTAKSINMDMYLMYLAIIVLFGCFYDSYETTEPLQFITMQHWLENMDLRMESLSRHDEATLRAKEGELNVNWLALLRKWTDMDSIKETAKKQDARTNSRLSFLNMTKDFLIEQHLLQDIGNQELELTDKAKTIYISYYMDREYNKGITDFMYNLDHHEDTKEGENHAVHQ
ncbi:MAG: DUF6063 family protein [Megasphaera sp.]|jgi:hypothetical protein|nr:DUF6063 family protein [Megasphaera sp.]MCH4187389.1 DUF6063 family protein [Megasphaera sp.]MCH4217571.1 DUF6063 family protein [Megasphaera sp.]